MLQLVVVFILFFYSSMVFNQERGNYFLKNFDPKESGLNAQTWTGMEDNTGVIYFVSGNKIATYDGKNWSYVRLDKDATPLSLGKDNNGVIYVGGVGELGYFFPNKQGKVVFESLLKFVPKKYRDFQNIWSTECLNGHVYFSTDQGILDWDGKKIKFIEKPVFFTLVKGKDRIYFSTKNEGLHIIDHKGIRRVKNGSYFINTPLVGGTILNDDEMLFLSGNDGFVIYNEVTGEFNRSNTNFLSHNTFIKEAYVYCLTKTVNGKIAVGTINKGLQLFDKKGNLENEITVNQGLINNAINNVFNDRFGNLWMCTDKGVSRVEINTGIKNWGITHGVEGTVEDVIRFNNDLYIANSTSVRYLSNGQFIPVKGIDSESWKFEIVNGQLFVANAKGLFQINSKTKCAEKLTKTFTIWSLVRKGNDLLLGGSKGVYIYQPSSKKIIELCKTQSPVRSIIFDKHQMIWFATDNKGVGCINNDQMVTYISKKQGLRYKSYNEVYSFKNQVLVATKSGLFTFNYSKNRLVKFKGLGDFLSDDKVGVFRLKEDELGNFYCSSYGGSTARISYINPINKTRDTLAFKRLPKLHIYSFYGEKNVVWLGTPDGLYKYDRSESKNLKNINKTLIRSVVFGKDSLLFAGVFAKEIRGGIPIISLEQTKENTPSLVYKLNQVSFIFSSPFYSSEDKIVFQYKLEGFDSEWSEWTSDNFKSYTNLYEGDYTFLVRSQNVYGELSEIGKYHFKVLPPWYRTIVAYVIYLLIFVCVIYVVVRIYTKRLREANIRLENIVQERTAEVVRQKDEIEEKNMLITESIQYAKNIQEAIVTSTDYFKQLFKDVFILFKPKDIVSGDFYWAYKTKSNKVFWSTADCTGHGVPGAFMTMIGISLLNEIVIEKEIEETNEILDVLRDTIIKTLNKNIDLESDEKMRNGMDISLCCWDLNTNMMTFSGANNPVLIVRSGELIEFKGDKQPIGVFKKMTPFTQHTIELLHGDKIYTFSDGYADQMNEEEVRFKIANLKKLILENASLPAHDQVTLFDSNYENWKGNYDQMDDVVLIGVEI